MNDLLDLEENLREILYMAYFVLYSLLSFYQIYFYVMLQLLILCNDQSWLGKKPFDPDFGQYKGSKKYAEQVHSYNIETTGEMYAVHNTEYYKHQAA